MMVFLRHCCGSKIVKTYPLSLKTVLVLLGSCGAGLGQPVLNTGTLGETGV